MPSKPPKTPSTAQRRLRTRSSDPAPRASEGKTGRTPRPVFSFLNARPKAGRTQLLPAVTQHVRIDHVGWLVGGISDDLIENVGELNLVFVARDIADMR